MVRFAAMAGKCRQFKGLYHMGLIKEGKGDKRMDEAQIKIRRGRALKLKWEKC